MGDKALVDYRAGTDKRIFSDGNPTDDRAIRSQCGAFFYESLTVLRLAYHCRARIIDVGEDHTRAAKNIVFQGYGVVYGHVVLNFDIVAYGDIIADEDILTKRASGSNAGLCGNMDEMPDTASLSQY